MSTNKCGLAEVEREIKGDNRRVSVRFLNEDGSPLTGHEAIVSFHVSRFAEGIDDEGYVYLDSRDIVYDHDAHISIPEVGFELSGFRFDIGQNEYIIIAQEGDI